MKKAIGIFILLLLFEIFSCRKKAVDVDPNYVGRWIGKDGCNAQLKIEQSDHASYTNRYNLTDCQRGEYSGKARLKGNTLIIGRGKFAISLPPTTIDTLTISNQYYPHDPPLIREKSIMVMVLGKYDTLYKVME